MTLASPTAHTDLLNASSLQRLAPVQALRLQLLEAKIEGLKVDWVFEDMLRRGVAAWTLAERAGAIWPQEAFVLGLSQDLGLLHLVLKHPEKAPAVEDMAALPAARRLVLEQSLFGQDHAAAYAAAADALGLSQEWTPIIQAHHRPDAPLDARSSQRLLQLSRAADALADLTQAEGNTGTRETLQRLLDTLPSRQPLTVRTLFDAVREAMPTFARALGWPIEEQPAWSTLQQESGPSALFVSEQFEGLTRALTELEQTRKTVQAEIQQQAWGQQHQDPESGALTFGGLSRRLRGALDSLAASRTPFAVLWLQGLDAQGWRLLTPLLRTSDALCLHEGAWVIFLSDTDESGSKVVQDRILRSIDQPLSLGASHQDGAGLLPGVAGILQQARESALPAD